jgi:hypothetical protein
MRAIPRGMVAVAALALLPHLAVAAPAPVDAADAAAIAVEAYRYAYPLVLSELTRRAETNVGDGGPPNATGASMNGAGAPMNQFLHQRTLPDSTVVEPLRPNADVLASSLWFDVGAEPLVVSIPESGGRYYTLPMFDLWSDVFAAPGPRTSGGGAQTYALTAPGWSGTLPAGVARIAAPTAVGRIVARVQTHGSADYDAVHRWQDGLKAVPLSRWQKDEPPPRGTLDPTRDRQAPAAQILRLPIERYFEIFTALTTANPPHPNDVPILQRMARIGLAPGTPFGLDQLSPDVRAIVQHTPTTSGQALFDAVKRAGTRVNGWRSLLSPMGTYGTDYLRRQVVAYNTFGADLSEDVYYLTTISDAEGKPLESSNRYAIHFDPSTLPPTRAFWSLTIYDDRQLLPLGTRPRVTIGSRDPLVKNADGSLDLSLQAAAPGTDKNANWLPTPTEGRFSLMLRLYWAETAALDGTWLPPTIVRADK